ncbi:MAG: hypothetical protein QW641_00030 [Candidatus Aenigmatarchaeota archaeon]
MKWRKEIRDFVFWKENNVFLVNVNYLFSIANWFPNFFPRNPIKGFGKERYQLRMEIENEIEEEKRREKFIELLECLAKQISEEGYSSLLYPTMITEPNLFLGSEKLPEEEEIWKTIYLIYCYSLKIGNSIITFDNISEESKQKFWRLLISERIVTQNFNLAPVKNTLKVRLNFNDKFFVTLSLLAYWVKKFSENEESSSQDFWSEFISKLGWSHVSSLIIFARERSGKSTYYIFPRFSKIIFKWFDSDMSLLRFLNSLTNIRGISEEKLKLIRKEREKLIYNLFKYNEINGELLSSCVSLKISYELKAKKERVRGFDRAKDFFYKLR